MDDDKKRTIDRKNRRILARELMAMARGLPPYAHFAAEPSQTLGLFYHAALYLDHDSTEYEN